MLREGGGLVAGADKTGNSLGGAHRKPGLVVHDHANQHVTGENLFFNFGFLALFDVDFILSGDEDFKDTIFELHGLDTLLKVVGNFTLVARIGVNDVPEGFGKIGLGNN